MSNPTIGLCIISPDKPTAKRLLDRYSQYFDDVYLELTPNIKNFANARQKGLKKVKTDFWMWVDTDDDIKNPEAIPKLIEMLEKENLDAVYLPYEYMKNDNGDVVAYQWRERIMRTSHPFKWVGAIHETVTSKERPQATKSELVTITHNHTEDDSKRSIARNDKILTAEYNKAKKANQDVDPRILYYLGRTRFDQQNYGEAIKILREYIASSGWDEEKYFAHIKIADSLAELEEYDASKEWALQAMDIQPDYPDAYLSMAKICFMMDEHDKCLEWISTAKKKRPPETLSVTDPTMYTYRPLVLAAMCHFLKGRIEKAYKLIQIVYDENPTFKGLEGTYKPIKDSYYELQVIRQAITLGEVVQAKGDLKGYIKSLPAFIRNDLRLKDLRKVAYPARQWEDDEIAIFCGETYNPWGPDTLHEGMGGSEEAITYLAPELAKLGYRVTVYNQREDGLEQDGVIWKPWELFNPDDKFNIWIGWRQPDTPAMLGIKAKFIGMDMHDYIVGHQQIVPRAAKKLDKVFFKSKYQRDACKILPDEKTAIIPNGIVKEQFEGDVEKQPFSVGYFSSYDRGLPVLLDMWPTIREACPDATLDIAYGWDSFDGMHKGNPERMRWKWSVIRKLNELKDMGVREHGRLSHEELARLMKSIKVWAYPTSFNEIHCITAVKAQEAGMIPVTTYNYALKETISKENAKYCREVEFIHNKPKEQEKFAKDLIKALKDDNYKIKPVPGNYWEDVARRWSDEISSSSGSV